MSTIFISYRRDDTQGFAGRLEDDLSGTFGEEAVFRDREIPAGTDFARHLERTLSAAKVVLAVIGPRWLDVRGADGSRRLDDPDDWVRREIEMALVLGLGVVPVLVGGADMPSPADLPDGLRPLAGRQAFVLSDRRWRDEINELAAELTRIVPSLGGSHAANVPRWSGIDPAELLRDVLGKRATPPPRGLAARVGALLLRGFGRFVSLGLVLAVIFVLIRADGDPRANRVLDNLLGMVMTAVGRLSG